MADDDKGDKTDTGKDSGTGKATEEQLAEMRAALAKANKEAEAERKARKALEDKDKPDLERLANELKEANDRAAKSETRAMRLEIAVAKKLTPAQANRLVGSTKEELERDADEFLKEIGGAKSDDDNTDGAKDDKGKDQSKDDSRGPTSTRPKPDLKGGSDPTSKESVELDPAKLAASVPRQ